MLTLVEEIFQYVGSRQSVNSCSVVRPAFRPQLSLGMNNLTDVRGLSYHLGGNNVTTGDPYNFDHYITPRTLMLSVAMKY